LYIITAIDSNKALFLAMVVFAARLTPVKLMLKHFKSYLQYVLKLLASWSELIAKDLFEQRIYDKCLG